MTEDVNDMAPTYEGIPISLEKNEESLKDDNAKNNYQYYERLAKFTMCIAAFVYLATSCYLFLPKDFAWFKLDRSSVRLRVFRRNLPCSRLPSSKTGNDIHVSNLDRFVKEDDGTLFTGIKNVQAMRFGSNRLDDRTTFSRQTMTKKNLDRRNEISLTGHQSSKVDADEDNKYINPPIVEPTAHEMEKGELKRHSIKTISTSTHTNDRRIFDGQSLSELRSSNKNRAILVYFYTTWCAQCQKNLPMWETLTEEGAHGALIFKVDCGAHKEVCRQQGIRAYPSINLFIHGTTSFYRGVHQARHIRSFVGEKMVRKDDVEENLQKNIREASNSWEVNVEYAASIKNYQAALADSENVVIVFTSSVPYCNKCKTFRPTWQNYAKHVHSAGMTNLLVAEVDCHHDQCPPGPYPRYGWYHEGALVGDVTVIVDPSSITVESLMTTTRMVLDMEAQHSFD